VLNTRLEELGMGDFEQFTQTVAALISLQDFGISQDDIINICHLLQRHGLSLEQIVGLCRMNRFRQQEWQRGRNWSAA